MKKLFIFALIFSISSTTVLAQSSQFKVIEEVPQQVWDNLSTKKIYFGHHSVGSNIMDGVHDIIKKHSGIKLNIVHDNEIGSKIWQPAFVHGHVGRNMDPESKIKSFKKKINDGYGQTADIAFFKFCFIDFNPGTDIDALFKMYTETMDTLIKTYPDVHFVIVTTPLTCYAPGPSGWVKWGKDFIKEIIGKINMYDHSSANRFNELLIQKYNGKTPIFDLARYESTRADSSRAVKIVDGQRNFELVQDYTSDGGHLNEKGKKIIAEKLLLFLANLTDNIQQDK